MDIKKIIIPLLFISILLLSGCVNFEVEQELKRNGHYDMDLKISTSSEYKMALSSFKESLKVRDSVKDKFEYKESENSITYSFKNIDPSKDKKLFKEVEKNETENQFTQTDRKLDTSFVSPKNIDIKKEFNFPYYEYTYELKTSSTDKEDETKEETLSKEDYIIDEAGVLDKQSKNEMIQEMNNIYQDDSIETIVVTKEQMNSTDFISYKYNFIRDFDFKKSIKEYVLVFMSTNEGGVCKIKSNVLTDSRFSSKIRNLNTEFSENCKGNYSTSTKKAVEELDNFFKKNDIESSSEIGKQMEEAFKVGYTVKVFGEIVETNGLKMSDKKVKFEVAPSKQGEYNIVFKDFFLTNLLGELYWVYFLLLIIIILVGAGYLTYFEIKKRRSSNSLKPPLAVDPRIVNYVKKARDYGMSDEQIRKTLLQSGWSDKEIDIALRS